MTTTFKISKGVICSNLPNKAIEKIEKDLTFTNPIYANAMKQGRYISSDIPAVLELFEYGNDKVWIPRGYIFYLIRWMKENNHKFKVKDHTLLLKPLDLKFRGELRPYQMEAAKDMLSYPVGVLDANTGSGKTVMLIYIIVQRQQPTLIIVHSKELLYQWEDRILQFTGESSGLIGDGKFNVKPITIGIINTVKNNIDKLSDKFGMVIVDECHKIAANSYMDSLQEFPAKYYQGATATSFRRDGLGHTIFASIGPKKHTINKQMLFDTKAVLIPEVFRIGTNFHYMFLNDYSTMIKKLTEDEKRNELICSTIHSDFALKGESTLIVSDRKKHLETMQKTLKNRHGDESLVLTGSTRKKERKEIVEKIKNGQCKILFASLSLISEGFDLPDLTVLFLTTPIKYKGKLIQCCGRILRPKKGKRPRVYDFRDNMTDVLKYSGYSRDRVYKTEWNK